MAGKYQKKRIPRKGGALRIALLLALVLLTSGGIGTAVAKYIQSAEGKLMVKAPEFYFTSDLLTADGNASYMLNSGTEQVEFILSNGADKLRVSEVDIGYTVSVDNGAAVTHVSKLTDIGTVATTLPKDQLTEATYRLTGLKPGFTYTVTATAKAGYSQTLSAKFQVAGNDENIYKNLTVSPDGYLLLTVWTHNVADTLTIRFPDGVVPDNTNVDMEDVFNKAGDSFQQGSFDSPFNKYSSQTYRFFGKASGSDFTVTRTVNGSIHSAEESALP